MRKIKEKTLKNIAYWIIIPIAYVIVAYGCWKVARHINWKFGYGPKIEQRIQSLEDRIEVLEEIADIAENYLKSEKN